MADVWLAPLFLRHARAEASTGAALLRARNVPACTPRASTRRTAGLKFGGANEVAAPLSPLQLHSGGASASHASVKSARTHQNRRAVAAGRRRGEPEAAGGVRAGPDEGVVPGRGDSAASGAVVSLATRTWPKQG